MSNPATTLTDHNIAISNTDCERQVRTERERRKEQDEDENKENLFCIYFIFITAAVFLALTFLLTKKRRDEMLPFSLSHSFKSDLIQVEDIGYRLSDLTYFYI